jgi:hypothetical protein
MSNILIRILLKFEEKKKTQKCIKAENVELPLYLFNHHAKKMHGGVEVQLHASSTSALGGSEC